MRGQNKSVPLRDAAKVSYRWKASSAAERWGRFPGGVWTPEGCGLCSWLLRGFACVSKFCSRDHHRRELKRAVLTGDLKSGSNSMIPLALSHNGLAGRSFKIRVKLGSCFRVHLSGKSWSKLEPNTSVHIAVPLQLVELQRLTEYS